MEKYLIFTDGACDIDQALIEETKVRFIPMEYSLKEEMRIYTGLESEKKLKELYDGQRKGDFTKTTQISPFNYIELFSPFMKEGYSILYLSLSAGLSQTYNSARLAKETLKDEFPQTDLYVIDTLAATGGMGVLCERACRNKESGMTIQENYDDIISTTKNICHWFFVQDLNYLKRGGRISAAAATFGTMLHIKPVLKIDNAGKLVVISKKHGDKKAVQALFEIFQSTYDETSVDAIYVTHADNEEMAKTLVTKIKEKFPSAKVKQKLLSPIIGAHVGPEAILLCYMGI